MPLHWSLRSHADAGVCHPERRNILGLKGLGTDQGDDRDFGLTIDPDRRPRRATSPINIKRDTLIPV